MDTPLSEQELRRLEVLHREIDEHKRKQTMSVAAFAKKNLRYLKLRKRFVEHGAGDNAA